MFVPDSASAALWPPSGDDLKTAAAILTLLFGGGLVTNVVSRWRERVHKKRVIEKLPVGDFLPETVKAALRYYVEHEVSAIDPAGRERDRANLGPREPLFRLLDRTLYETHEKQYLLLLADSGMGKTTALLNYYAHNTKRKRPHPIVIFSLRTEGVVDKIASITDKPSTVLLLDALDEDPTAVTDHTRRVHILMDAAKDFRAVIISCRSQFFLSTEEITKETGIARLHHRGLGEPAEYLLLKFYLCPFSDAQVAAFLRKRYPFPRLQARRLAQATVDRVRDLTARPMLLAYLDDLTRSGRTVSNITDAYSEIVDQWIRREKPLVENSAALLEFSKKLAVDLFIRREDRGGEQAAAREILGLAHQWNISLERWQLTGRSLLTRDAVDQFRFAHRSVLEYLFIRSFLEGDTRCATVEWTDQMYTFFFEMSGTPYFESDVFLQHIRNVTNTLQAAASDATLNTALLKTLLDRILSNFLFAVGEMQAGFDSKTNPRLFDDQLCKLVITSHIKPFLQLIFAGIPCATPRVNVLGIVRARGNGFKLTLSGDIKNLTPGMSRSEEKAIIETSGHFDWDAPQTAIFTHTGEQGYTICLPFAAKGLFFGFVVVIHFVIGPDDLVVITIDQLLDYFRWWIDQNRRLPDLLSRGRSRFLGFPVANDGRSGTEQRG